MTDDSDRPISRRTFLKTIAAASSVLAVPIVSSPTVAHAAIGTVKARATAIRANIGVILPQAATNESLNQSFTNGFKLALQGKRNDVTAAVQLVVRESGVQQQQLQATLADLFATAKPDLIVGLLRSNVTSSIETLLTKQRRCLVATSLSATVPNTATPPSWSIDFALPYWQSAWALGQWAAQNMGKRAAILHSFAESGYDSAFAFGCGFAAGGGEIVTMTVTHAPTSTTKLAETLETVAATQPDVVYLGYTGELAAEMLTAVPRSGLRGLPVCGTGAMVEGAALNRLGNGALGLRTATVWDVNATDKTSTNFVRAYQNATRTSPDHWSLLGFEIASLITVVAQSLGNDWQDPAMVRTTLLNAQIESPRGLVGPQTSASTFVIREVRQNRKGLVTASIANVNATPLADPQIAALQTSLRSGCSLPYLG